LTSFSLSVSAGEMGEVGVEVGVEGEVGGEVAEEAPEADDEGRSK
jgi:hypothetical protein